MNNRPTLFEVAILIVVIGILAALAIPRNAGIDEERRATDCKLGLATLRSAAVIAYANGAMKTGVAQWPTAEELRTLDGVVGQTMPKNPYQALGCAPDSVVYGSVKGQVYGSRGGWVYNPETGEIWPNTNVVGENVW